MEQHLLAIVGSGFVLILVADLIGNNITFTSRVSNALVTSIVWGLLFLGLNFLYATLTAVPLLSWEPDHFWLWAAVGVVLAFLADFVGNTIAFRSRYRNSFVTACIWAAAFYTIVVIWICNVTGTCVFF